MAMVIKPMVFTSQTLGSRRFGIQSRLSRVWCAVAECWILQVLGSTSGVGLTSGKTHVQAAGVDLTVARVWALRCAALRCAALRCAALPCPALPCPALPWHRPRGPTTRHPSKSAVVCVERRKEAESKKTPLEGGLGGEP